MPKSLARGIIQLFATALVALMTVATNAHADQHDAGVRRALLIGINDYKVVRDLRGAVNDVELMSDVLKEAYGFRSENITILVNEQATRSAMLAALDDLVADSGPGDLVLIHFAGHGAPDPRVYAGDTNVADSDSTLIPYDGRTDGIRDILDDELSAILDRFRTSDVVVVLDSCYSGTGTRDIGSPLDEGPIERSVPPDDRIELYRDAATRSSSTRAIVVMSDPDHVLLAAAPVDKPALDGYNVEGKPRGYFSYAVAQAFRKLGPAATPIEIEQDVKKTYRRLTASRLPEPQFEGSGTRLDSPIFPSLVGRPDVQAIPLRYVYVDRIDARTVRLKRGALAGAAIRSEWAIYPPDETGFASDSRQARALVSSHDGLDAIATLVETPGNEIRPSSRAIPTWMAPGDQTVAVGIRHTRSADQAAIMAAVKTRLDAVEFVEPGEFASFLLEVDGNEVVVSEANGTNEIERFRWSSAEDAAAKLASVIERSRDSQVFDRLTNPSSSLALDARVVTAGGERGIEIVDASSDTAQYRIRRNNEPRDHSNSLMLEIEADQDSYITVVDLDANGELTLLFPNWISEREGFYAKGFVKKGTKVRIPDSLQSGNRAGFHLDYSEPPGVDTVTVFATTELAVAEQIRQVIRDESSVGDVSMVKVAEELNSARGIDIVADDDESSAASDRLRDWTAVSLDIRVNR